MNVALQDLKRRLHDEQMREEHARMVRVRHYLTVSCLPKPEASPWMYIWYYGTDTNFLTVTSLCRSSFCRLLERFSLFYHIPTFRAKGGRPVKMKHHHQVLGLLLAFYVGSMGHKTLCSNFGVPHSTLSVQELRLCLTASASCRDF
ncbi:Hypothetical protein PHPALM_578 [Phytophthora palmivora]|uniref:Uncharacterized protein n=1 Tax=Phytophthora palmivora TaxID=4796 RepID=A0A2P4YUH9_9STRA|nr:Hypothetical protein PHPALM_578 [Phytophthora palmivora]